MNISVVWSDQIEDYLPLHSIFSYFWTFLVNFGPPWCQNKIFCLKTYKIRFTDLKSTNFDVLHFDLDD